jgi:hypothetical protein
MDQVSTDKQQQHSHIAQGFNQIKPQQQSTLAQAFSMDK